MWEFGGLWKHHNNPACTKSVSLFQTVEVEHCITEEEEEGLRANITRVILEKWMDTLTAENTN